MRNRIRTTATQAARDFSRLLDRVATGTEALIERHSRPIALLSPVEQVPRRLSECLAVRLPRPSAAPDASFVDDLKEIIRGNCPSEPPAWD